MKMQKAHLESLIAGDFTITFPCNFICNCIFPQRFE